jgi:hypothetical protein
VIGWVQKCSWDEHLQNCTTHRRYDAIKPRFLHGNHSTINERSKNAQQRGDMVRLKPDFHTETTVRSVKDLTGDKAWRDMVWLMSYFHTEITVHSMTVKEHGEIKAPFPQSRSRSNQNTSNKYCTVLYTVQRNAIPSHYFGNRK